jgi:hypothetical protein
MANSFPVVILRNVAGEEWPADWTRGCWYEIGAGALPRLLAYANSALSLRAFFADKELPVPGNAMRAFVRRGAVDLALDELTFRLHLAPACAPKERRLALADIVKAEWKYEPPKVRTVHVSRTPLSNREGEPHGNAIP